ncbi:MAG: S8 family serine peptidase, partial [Saprospiraceae bacterium]|nr:S8 family serine peptidase [Saprospiraceae bacterium]
MNSQTKLAGRISLFVVLAFMTLGLVSYGQEFRPLIDVEMSVDDIASFKERVEATKMSADLFQITNIYQEMKSGESINDVMPLAKDFLVIRGDKIALEIVSKDVDNCISKLTAKGAVNVRHYKNMINCLLPMAQLSSLKGLPEADRIDVVKKPVTNIGAVTSQGDAAQNSNIARQFYGVDGTGNKIGVLSDSYDDQGGAAMDITWGDLPGAGNPNGFTTPVDVVSDFGGGASDEGRAMLQIVHDVAPGAELAFHTAFMGQVDFALGILDLFAAGCNIIVDDVIYFTEPYFMPGIVSQLVTVADGLGAMYFSSAGNSDRDSYEAIYTQGAPLCPFYVGAHEFAPGDQFLQVDFAPGNYTIILQWDEPFYSVTGAANPASDLDLVVWDQNLNFLGGSFAFNNSGTGDAFEGVQAFFDGTFNFSIEHYDGPAPNRVKIIIYGSNAALEFGNTAPTIVGHANTAEACAVGASAWFFTPYYGVDPPGLNNFSSWGGVPIVLDALGNPLPSPLDLRKPDFVGPDGGNTTFFVSDIPQDPDIFPNFFGTSASAPHAAAAAALIFEANPGYTKAEVKADMVNTAIDMLTPGFDYGSGAGLINIGAAISSNQPLNVAPNCRNINSAIDPDGIARINLSNLIVNGADGVGELEVTLHRGPVLLSRKTGQYITDYIIIPEACSLAGQELKVTITNALGTCWSLITLKDSQIPYLPNRKITVYCDDDLVQGGGIGGSPPPVSIPCANQPVPVAEHAADWVVPYDCVPGVQDTVKVIIREWEAFDKLGRRGVAFDTIVVLQFPEITADNIYCEQKDTVYCADTTAHVGPFITYDRLGVCDTLYLVEISDLDNDGMLEFTAADFDDKCGLTAHLDAWKFGSSCEIQYKVVVEIKQDCYGAPQQTCQVTPPAGTPPNMAEQLGPGYWRCEFWITDLDTLPPVMECWDTTTLITTVYTGTHECAAHTYLPPIFVEDDWSGVKQVKARIEGIGTAIMIYNAERDCYESHTQFKLPHRDT